MNSGNSIVNNKQSPQQKGKSTIVYNYRNVLFVTTNCHYWNNGYQYVIEYQILIFFFDKRVKITYQVDIKLKPMKYLGKDRFEDKETK